MSALTIKSELTPQGNLGRYLRDIRRFPMLELDEEQRLAQRWLKKNDLDAGHKLVTSHLRLVAKIAMGYRGYGLPLADLIDGSVGRDDDDGNRNIPFRDTLEDIQTVHVGQHQVEEDGVGRLLFQRLERLPAGFHVDEIVGFALQVLLVEAGQV